MPDRLVTVPIIEEAPIGTVLVIYITALSEQKNWGFHFQNKQ